MLSRRFLVVVLVVAAGLGPLSALLFLSYRQTVIVAERTLMSLSGATARRSDHIFKVTQQSLRNLARETGGRIDPDAIRRMDAIVFSVPFIREIGVIRKGQLIANDRGPFDPPRLLKEKEHLIVPPPGQIRITPPYPTFRGGESVIVKLGIDADTYINALIDPELFCEFHDFLDEHGEQSTVFIVRDDGTPLATFGRMPVDALPLSPKNGMSHSDGHYFAVQPAADFPVYAVVAASSDHMLRDWRRNAFVFGSLGLLLSLLASMSAFRLAVRLISPEEDLRQAIKRGSFEVHYQPIVDLRTGQWIGAEALIRQRDSRGKLIPPSQFIPLAEQSGLIVPLTEWLFHRVAQELGSFLQAHPRFRLTLNVSARHLRSGRLLALVDQFGVHRTQLVIELTEHGLAEQDEGEQILHQLHNTGVRLAVDDFGTGYSNLHRLGRFPIDLLKIDKSFLDSIRDGQDTSGLVEAILCITRVLKLEVVGEGVEREDQAQWLRDHDVSLGQGWLFGKAMPWPEFLTKMPTTA